MLSWLMMVEARMAPAPSSIAALTSFSGGTQVTPELAREAGADEGFGRGTKGAHVATALVKLRGQA